MATEESTKNAPNLPSEWLPLKNGLPRPYWMPNQEMPRSAYAMYKAAFREQQRAPITVSMTTYCEAYMLDMDQWYIIHAQCNLPPFSNPRMVSCKSHTRIDGYDGASSGSSHYCPKSRRDPCDDRLFHRYYPGQFRLWSLPRLNFIKRKPNRNTCRITDYNYNPEAPMHPNSEIQVTLPPSHNGNRQSIWWRSHWRSNEFSKREIAMSTRSTPTDKSKPIKKSTEKSTKKSTKIPLKPPIKRATMKSTGWSPKRTSNHDYRLNATYRWLPTERYSTQHCTKARNSASSLDRSKYNHL